MASISDLANPWKGLSSYTEGEIIYGRDKDIENLFTLITTNQEITILYGQSGIGKTSLLRAGLFPWLRSSHIFPVYVRLGHDETDKSYVEQVIETVENEAQKYHIKQTDLAPNTEAPKSLWEFLHRYDFHTESGEKCVPMIFFDQFEELFTISANRTKYVDEFIKDLGNVLNGTTPEYLLEIASAETNNANGHTSNKIEKESELDIDIEIEEQEDSSLKTKRDFLLAISIREDYIYHLDRISAGIPALKRNRYFLHGLDETGAREVIKCPVKNLVDNTVTNEIIDVCHNADEKYISPAFISLLMYNLFERMQEKGQTAITSSLVSDSIGDIFYNYYENSIKGLSENSIDFLEDRLISKGGFRLTVPVSDALAAGVTQGEIKQLEDKRLIVRSKRGNNDFIELTHDLLCKEISKDKEDRDKIKKARQNRKRTVLLSSIMAIVLVIAGVFIWQYEELKKQRTALLTNQSRSVAAIANQLVDNGDSNLGTLLALEVLPENIDKPNKPYTLEAEGALRKSLLSSNSIIHSRYAIDEIAISPDGKYLVTSSNPGKISLWNAETGEQIWETSLENEGFVFTLTFCEDTNNIIALTSLDKIFSYDATTGQLINQLYTEYTDDMHPVGISDDGHMIAFLKESTLYILDSSNGKNVLGSPIIIEGYKTSEGLVPPVIFSKDRKKIAANFANNSFRVWDTERGDYKQFHGHNDFIQCLILSEDGKRIATGSFDETVRIWDAETGKQIGEPFEGNIALNAHIALSPDGKIIAIGTKDNTILLRNLETGVGIDKPLQGHTMKIDNLKFSPINEQLISSSQDKTIRIWDYNSKVLNNEPSFELDKDTQLYSLSPDGNMLLELYNRDFILQDVTTKNQIIRLTPKTPIGYDNTKLSKDSKKLALVAGNDIYIWNIAEQKQKSNEPKILKGHTDFIRSLDFSPDGRKIVSCSSDSTIRVWDTTTGKQIGKPINWESAYCPIVKFSPDGTRIASLSSKSVYPTLTIWYLEKGEPLGDSIKLPDLSIDNIEFSPDGKKIIYSSSSISGGNILTLDIETGDYIGSPINGSLLFSSNIFSPDGRFYVAYLETSAGEAIEVVEISSGKLLLEIPFNNNFPEENFANVCQFSRDGSKILLGYKNGELFSYDWKPLQELIDEQRERFKDRKLTPEERQKYYLE